MNVVWLGDAVDPGEAGQKAFSLSKLIEARLPVPYGFCLTGSDLEKPLPDVIAKACSKLGAQAVAVRSSAAGEDSSIASFAGIFLSRLNVIGISAIMNAVSDVRASEHRAEAGAYARKLGISRPPRIAILIQEFIAAEASGVLFMQEPFTAEGAWGLGPTVADGIVTPDQWRFSPTGEVLSTSTGNKDIAVVPMPTGGTAVAEVERGRRKTPCLQTQTLKELFELGMECNRIFGSPQDIEWAYASGRLWILQSRPITSLRHGAVREYP